MDKYLVKIGYTHRIQWEKIWCSAFKDKNQKAKRYKYYLVMIINSHLLLVIINLYYFKTYRYP